MENKEELSIEMLEKLVSKLEEEVTYLKNDNQKQKANLAELNEEIKSLLN